MTAVTEVVDSVAPVDVTAEARAQAVARTRPLSVTGLASMMAGAALWTSAVGWLAVTRHRQFLSHRFDLGNMVQAVWSTTQGRPLEMTDGTTGDQIVRLGAHVDPILVLFAPLWWMHPGPETLIVAYIGVLAAGIYPVVRLALKYTSSWLAASLLAAWYLVLPWIIWIALNEVNPVGLALPLLLYAIWFLDEHRLGLFAAFAVLAVLTGELVGLSVAALGAWYAVRHRRPRVGCVIAVAAAAWTVTCVALVVPAFNHGEPSRYYAHFESVGASPVGLLRTLLTDPGAVVGQLATWDDLRYVLLLAASGALLSLGQPLLLVALVPQLGVNMLSSFPSTASPKYHYAAPVLAVLVAASIMAIGRFRERARVFAAAVPLVAAIVLLGAVPPLPGTERYLAPRPADSARIAAMREALELVPSSAPVSVTNRLGAHLSARRVVHLFPALSGAEWTVLDTRDPSNSKATWIGPIPFGQLLARLDRDPAWHLVFERESVRVYRRAAP